jgi:benzoyl-CoA reductase/2-hydroxyglutaryl-CoA dehydratase subunit BcrC/BadD/HgdB
MRIGITATIPVEIVLASGHIPVDLNNVFITSGNPAAMLASAEGEGMPHCLCAWIKGVYAAAFEAGIDKVVAVTGGDCSNTVAMAEVLAFRGMDLVRFSYPIERSREELREEMEMLMKTLSTTWKEVEGVRRRLKDIRRKLSILDSMTYRDNLITGRENHLFLVSSSDFGGDPVGFENDLDAFLRDAGKRSPLKEEVRLGYIGVPTIFSGFYELIESLGARVVFNEVQRQFSMPYQDGDIVDQYLQYTLPYSIEGRIADIRKAVEDRAIDGLIHYTQTFCYRQIYDVLLKECLAVPILTLEGDRPGPVDGRTAVRIETFIEMLKAGKKEQTPIC